MSSSTSNVIHAGSTEAFQQVIQSPALSVVDFWAPWCGPCQAYGPIVDAYADNAPEGVNILKVNVDDLNDIAREYGIRSIPSTLFFRNGEEIGRANGVLNAQQLASRVDSYL